MVHEAVDDGVHSQRVRMKKFSVVQRHKSRGIKTWYGRIYDVDTGSVQYVSLGVEKKKDAVAWRDRMISDQLNGRSLARRNVSISEAIESFLKTVSGSRLTFYNYKCALYRLERWLCEKGVKDVDGITPIYASEFVSGLSEWTASTRKKRLTIIRIWSKWVIEMYEPNWKKDPFKSVKVKGGKSRPRDFWTIGQVEDIIAATENPKCKLMYAFMAFAGLRFHEFRKLTLDDIFEDNGEVKEKVRIEGKGGKVAFVPVCERLKKQILNTYNPNQNNTQFLEFWSTAKGKKIPIHTTTNYTSNKDLQELFSQNPNLASFGGKVHLHRFRHSFVSNLVRAGCNIRCVADLARHENVMITYNTYAHLLPSDTEKALEIFSQKNNKEVLSENN